MVPPRVAAPENDSWLLEAAPVEPFFDVFGGSYVWICLVQLPGAAPGAASTWRLPELFQSCTKDNIQTIVNVGEQADLSLTW